METSLGGHLVDDPIHQLDSLVGPEEAGLGHALIVLPRPAVNFDGRDRHLEAPRAPRRGRASANPPLDRPRLARPRPRDRFHVGDQLAGLGGGEEVADHQGLEGGPLGEGLVEEGAAAAGGGLGGAQAGGFEEQEVVDVVEQRRGGETAVGAQREAVEDGAGGVGGAAQEDLEDPAEVDVDRLGAQHVAQQQEGAVVGLDDGEELGGRRLLAVGLAGASASSCTSTSPALRSL